MLACVTALQEPKILVASLPDVLSKYHFTKIFEYTIRIVPQIEKTYYFVGKHDIGTSILDELPVTNTIVIICASLGMLC